jgi:tetratricopeptide (TPR) repeat protein
MPNLNAFAAQFGEIHYNDTLIDYSKIDKDKTLYFADFYFDKALKEKNNEEKLGYLQKASGMYFLLSQIDSGDLYPIVQMARVYDYENQNSYAKAYFYKALKIERYNAATNYYFGEYYYSRDDYRRALYFYNTAFENGYRENYDVLLKMAIMYEKLGDLLRANQYYKKAFLVKPDSKELPEKIREIEAIKYKNTGYYNSLKRK